VAAVAGFTVFGLLMALLVAAVVRFAVRLHRADTSRVGDAGPGHPPSGTTLHRRRHT
jgi:hypothetical protein